MQATLLPARNPRLCIPITSNRELGECRIANVAMQELLETDLYRAGFQLVDPSDAKPRTLRIPIDNWIELGALLLLARSSRSACLQDPEGNVLAWKGHDDPIECKEILVTEAEFFHIQYPWDLLKLNEQVVAMMDESSNLGEVSPLATLSGAIRIGRGTKILPGTVIEGPVVIGPNCHIGPNAYIRGASSIGLNCFVGNGAEVKNSMIYQNTYISRHCYVGDSIIGSHVTLGAGTCTENHRHDGRYHVSMSQGKPVNTGLLKFGAVIGDGVSTGVNTSIGAGIKIGIARRIQPGSYVSQDLL